MYPSKFYSTLSSGLALGAVYALVKLTEQLFKYSIEPESSRFTGSHVRRNSFSADRSLINSVRKKYIPFFGLGVFLVRIDKCYWDTIRTGRSYLSVECTILGSDNSNVEICSKAKWQIFSDSNAGILDISNFVSAVSGVSRQSLTSEIVSAVIPNTKKSGQSLANGSFAIFSNQSQTDEFRQSFTWKQFNPEKDPLPDFVNCQALVARLMRP